MFEFFVIVFTYTLGFAITGLVGMLAVCLLLAPIWFMRLHLMRSRPEPRQEGSPRST